MARTDAFYTDASALVKLVVAEPESAALGAFLEDQPALVSSELVLAEVPRAVTRVIEVVPDADPDPLRAAQERVLATLALVPLERGILMAAGAYSEPWLRTLDAVHVATALTLSDDLAAFVTYDERQARAARLAGLSVLMPA